MSAFADAFILVGLKHTRCKKPEVALTGYKHFENKLPEPVGKVHIDIYADLQNEKVYTRLYRLSDGEVAWYLAVPETPNGER